MIRAQIWLPEIWGPLLVGKKRLRQRTHKFGASKNMEALVLGEKKSARGNVPTSQGLLKIWDLF